MKPTSPLVYFFFIIFLLNAPYAHASDSNNTYPSLKNNTFHMSINRPQDAKGYQWIALVYKEVFKRINVNIKFSYQPLKRASIETNEGRMDGEPARIWSYSEKYTNLLRIQEPVYHMEVRAYASKPLVLDGWKSLIGTSYRVEYPRGMKACEDNLPRVVTKEQLTPVRITDNGIFRLAKNRSDIYIDDKNYILPILMHSHDELKDKVYFAGVMERVPLYMYIHKKHKAMLPALSKAIKAVREEGLIDKYHIQIYGY